MTEIMTETEDVELPGSAADAALLSLCNQLVDQIASGRAEVAVRQALALSAPPDPPRPSAREWRHLGPLALGHAEAANPDLPAAPDRPGEHFCDICGCADEKQIEPGPDKDTFGDDCAWMCTDANARACEARARHRYPPRPDLVPDAVLAALSATDEAHAARSRQYSGQAAAGQQEPAQEQEQYSPPGWSAATANGVYDVHGTWHPPVSLPPAWHPTAHLISGGAHMGHAISGGALMSHAMSGQARQLPPVLPQDGAQDAGGQQPARHEIPAEGLAPGVAEALHGGVGHDIQMQAPELPEAAPQRPARRPRNRYGQRRVLRYQGRR